MEYSLFSFFSSSRVLHSFRVPPSLWNVLSLLFLGGSLPCDSRSPFFFLSCCLSFTSLELGQGALIFISSFCWQTPSPRATEFPPFGCPTVHIVRPRLRQFGSTVRVRSNTLHLLFSPGCRAHQRGRQPALIAHPLASPF